MRGEIGKFTDGAVAAPILNKPSSITYPVNSSGQQVASGDGLAGANGGGLAATNVTVVSVICIS